MDRGQREDPTLWDWLNLGALPLVVVLIPVLIELRTQWGRPPYC
jgi:hypothetical protein